ncbi:MAG: hypothetical protein KC516_03830 [Nanoarchaeota archaeon]|nr:hypothetical protein [Nanoarchaeota archaeon]
MNILKKLHKKIQIHSIGNNIKSLEREIADSKFVLYLRRNPGLKDELEGQTNPFTGINPVQEYHRYSGFSNHEIRDLIERDNKKKQEKINKKVVLEYELAASL